MDISNLLNYKETAIPCGAEASRCFERAAELYPDQVESIGGMAYCLVAQGRLAEARSYYEAATR